MLRLFLTAGKFLTSSEFLFSALCAFWAILAPIHLLIYLCFSAMILEFITWNIADFKIKKTAGVKYKFDIGKAGDLGWKIVFVFFGICGMWSLDIHILGFLPGMYLADFCAAFFFGVEFLRIFGNAWDISHYQPFLWAKKFFKDKAKGQIDFDQYIEENENHS